MHRSQKWIIISSVLFSGCRTKDAQGVSSVETIASASQLSRRLALIDRQFTPTEICDDYALFRQLLVHVEPDANPAQDRAPTKTCPQLFSSMATAFVGNIAGLGDLHAKATFGYGLDASAYSVIQTCSPAVICDGLNARPLVAVPSEVSGHIYAAAPVSATELKFFEVLSVNGQHYDDIMAAALSNQTISWSQAGAVGFLADFALARQPLDGRDHGSMSIALRDLANGQTINVGTSFDPPQQYFLTQSQTETIAGASIRRTYGCTSTSSSWGEQDQGACVTVQGNIAAWMPIWLDSATPGLDFVSQMLNFFKSAGSDPLTKPVILDLRGSPGGDPKLVVDFLCTFGDDATVAAMAQRTYFVDNWPASFQLPSGGDIVPSQLNLQMNLDIFATVPGWKSLASDSEALHVQHVSLLTRFGLTAQQCVAMRQSSYSNVRWTILTNGSELSAAELFLSLVQHDSTKFYVMGEQTRGGSGSPISVTLSNTKIRVTLSQAREFDEGSNAFVIERLGVQPTEIVIPDTQSDFEAYLLANSTGQMTPGNSSQPQSTVARALDFGGSGI